MDAENASVNNDKIDNSKIIIVEDNEINMDLIKAMLERYDFNIVEAYDGFEAIEKINNNNDDAFLVLLDIGLPGIDGIEVFKRLKQSENTANIPVIAVTAHAMKGNKEHLLSLGFSDFIEKPIDKNILFEKINKFLI
ncbi:MAG: response regulator [Candidatus Acididesulfobacter diazotrophicus]|jgi:two-component system cell cycle response regulator DivK|uniref:Response regulator n=1 Tax=Candidatus Acididesulfobacter diazotrophicus TaxID=2597226 RepID=A0A519BMY1_9DELT|nr:MAG: response regulator [Candidatus Acididesulfobacter diazotrophicus]